MTNDTTSHRAASPLDAPSSGEHAAATRPFHLALRVDDLDEAEGFYAGVLGARIGRRDARWIDFDLGGHQITVHLDESLDPADEGTNPVDGDAVPVPQFGVVLDIEAWRAFAAAVEARGARFILGPRVRFEGEPGEQGTFFVRDPAGNALEFKGFRRAHELFAVE